MIQKVSAQQGAELPHLEGVLQQALEDLEQAVGAGGRWAGVPARHLGAQLLEGALCVLDRGGGGGALEAGHHGAHVGLRLAALVGPARGCAAAELWAEGRHVHDDVKAAAKGGARLTSMASSGEVFLRRRRASLAMSARGAQWWVR